MKTSSEKEKKQPKQKDSINLFMDIVHKSYTLGYKSAINPTDGDSYDWSSFYPKIKSLFSSEKAKWKRKFIKSLKTYHFQNGKWRKIRIKDEKDENQVFYERMNKENQDYINKIRYENQR